MDNIKKLGKGAVKQKKDERDIAFGSVAPFDWELGFDIELLLGFRRTCRNEAEFYGKYGCEGWGVKRYKEIVDIVKKKNIPLYKIPVKNQGQSYSCTGQALTYYLSVLNNIETGEYIAISARDVYAYISLGYCKGAYLRDALKLACKRGIGTENLVPCYHQNKPYTEREYLIKPKLTKELKIVRTALESKEYRQILGSGEQKMENMAWAMLLGFGAYFAVDGENNRGWLTEYPKIPNKVEWSHALYAGKAFLEKGQKIISPINSWGINVGKRGWQKLKKDYFVNNYVYDIWTLIDKKNMTNNAKIIKDKNSSAVGIWLPALSPEALKSYCLNFGIPIPTKDGKIDWDNWIDGELVLNKDLTNKK